MLRRAHAQSKKITLENVVENAEQSLYLMLLIGYYNKRYISKRVGRL